MNAKNIADNLCNKYGTRDPFRLAKHLNITILYADMKNVLGLFTQYKRSRFIHLSNHIVDGMEAFVCAHELGHAVCHPHINTPFLKAHTLFSTDRIEREANTFAVELLVSDSDLRNGYSVYDLTRCAGVPAELADLKKTERC